MQNYFFKTHKHIILSHKKAVSKQVNNIAYCLWNLFWNSLFIKKYYDSIPESISKVNKALWGPK